MSLSRDEADTDVAADSPEQSRGEYPFTRSRRGSLASSRFSSRLSRRSSVRDEVQSLDEFLRKQRVIRYMQEERERAERSKLLREEHDAWVEFRDQERVERLKYMTEQEIADLLRREADEARQEGNGVTLPYTRAAEDAPMRHQSLSEVRRREEDAVLARRKNGTSAEEQRRTAPHATPEKTEALAAKGRGNRTLAEPRQREESLAAKCVRLGTELDEAKTALKEAQRYRKRAEDDLARLQGAAQREKAANITCQETVAKLTRDLLEAREKLAATEAERNKTDAVRAAKVREAEKAEKELSNLKERLDNVVAEQERERATAAAAGKAMASPQAAEELKECKDALRAAVAARNSVESEVARLRLQVTELQQKATASHGLTSLHESDNLRKLKAAADDARKAQSDLLKEREAREKAEVETAEVVSALKEEKAARQRAEADILKMRSTVSLTQEEARLAEVNQKKLTEAEASLEKMHRARKKYEAEVAELKRNLGEVERDLEEERAARTQFEQLASQAVKADTHTSSEDIDHLRKQLHKAEEERDTARAHAVACQRNAEREVASLRTFCERLQQQHRQHQQQQLQEDGEGNDEFTPRVAPPTPHSRTSRSTRRLMPKGEAAAQKLASDKAAADRQMRALEVQVERLQENLAASKEHEKKALEEAEKVRKALKQANEKSSTLTPTNANQVPSQAPTKAQETAEKRATERIAALEKEVAEARAKYERLLESQKKSAAERDEAAKKAAAHTVSNGEEKRVATPNASVQTSSRPVDHEAICPPSVAVAAGDPIPALKERIAEITRQLEEEQAARQALESRLAGSAINATTTGAEATNAQKARTGNGEAYAASGADAKGRPRKAKSGCC